MYAYRFSDFMTLHVICKRRETYYISICTFCMRFNPLKILLCISSDLNFEALECRKFGKWFSVICFRLKFCAHFRLKNIQVFFVKTFVKSFKFIFHTSTPFLHIFCCVWVNKTYYYRAMKKLMSKINFKYLNWLQCLIWK